MHAQGVIPITRRRSARKDPWFQELKGILDPFKHKTLITARNFQDNKSYIEGQKQRSLQQPVLLPRPRASFFVSDTSLRRPGKATYSDEATAVVWIELLVLIGAQNMTSFHLEQTINKRIHLRKTEKGEKSAARAARCVRFEIFREGFLSSHFNPLSHVIYMQVQDVLRNYLARIRAFDNNFLFSLRHIYQLENKTPSNVKKWKPFFFSLSLVS